VAGDDDPQRMAPLRQRTLSKRSLRGAHEPLQRTGAAGIRAFVTIC